LITGFAAEKLEPLGVQTIHNRDFDDTNMVWSLYQAIQELENDFIICYGDIVVSPSTLAKLLKSPFEFALVSDRNWLEYWTRRFDEPLTDAESFSLNATGDLVSVGQKAQNTNEIQGQYIGLIKVTGGARSQFKKRLQQFCEDEGTYEIAKKAYMTDFLQILINEGVQIKPVFVNGGWIEIDNPDDINAAIESGRIQNIDDELADLG